VKFVLKRGPTGDKKQPLILLIGSTNFRCEYLVYGELHTTFKGIRKEQEDMYIHTAGLQDEMMVILCSLFQVPSPRNNSTMRYVHSVCIYSMYLVKNTYTLSRILQYMCTCAETEVVIRSSTGRKEGGKGG